MVRRKPESALLRHRLHHDRRLRFETLEDRRLLASNFELLKDINPAIDSLGSSPTNALQIGSIVYFRADDGVHGNELWKSDGTPEGTVLVKDVHVGSDGSHISSLTNVAGTLFFEAESGVARTELWKSDGTAAGTVLVKVFNFTDFYSSLEELTAVDNFLYFNVYYQQEQTNRIWRSDGTSAGTVMFKSISAEHLTNVGSSLFFVGFDGTATSGELWKSDGTAAGTTLLKDIRPGSAQSQPEDLINVAGTLYFRATDGVNGIELWKSDGTADGTVLVKDIRPGAESSLNASPQFTIVGSTLYFRAFEELTGFELWKSDGSSTGTALVKDIAPGASNANPTFLTNVDGVLYFQATNVSTGQELWTSDGSASGTVLVKNIRSGSAGSVPSDLTSAGGKLFFRANDGVSGNELWVSDGTDSGTARVKDIHGGAADSLGTDATLQLFLNVGGNLLFEADDGAAGIELWRSDGSETGTLLLKDIRTTGVGSSARQLTVVADTLFFIANDGITGDELWKTDGTSSGTALVKDIRSGAESALASTSEFVNVNGTLYFTADDGASGYELWKSDGTPQGTVLIKDLKPGSDSSAIESLRNINGTLYFLANDGSGFETWKTDGSANGTVMLKDQLVGAVGGNPFGITQVVNVGNALYFTALSGVAGHELWRSDGTPSGTAMVKDINPQGSPGISNLTSAGSLVYFGVDYTIRDDEFHEVHKEVWRSDGTPAGTIMLEDSRFTFSAPNSFYQAGNLVYFRWDDGDHNIELWRSDGSPGGTFMVEDIYPGKDPNSLMPPEFNSSDPRGFTEFGGKLYFMATDSNFGRELFSTDGTRDQVEIVRDVDPGYDDHDFRINGIARVRENLYFAARHPVSGIELWKTDGTESGTVLVQDINSGSPGSNPAEVTEFKGKIFVVASTPLAGREIWVVDLPQPGDYNGNGRVDAADYTVWRNTLDSTTDLRANGDATGASANVIDAADYVVWKRNFGGATFLDDYADNLLEATQIDLPDTFAASIRSATDRDWFRITVTAGQTYRFQTLLDGLPDSSLRLVSGDGLTTLAVDENGGAAQLDWTPATSGSYFLQIGGVGGATGDYRLVVTREDHSNSFAAATSASAPNVYAGIIESATDVDWFRFTAVAGLAHRFQVSLNGLGNSSLRLIAADGSTELASDNDGGSSLINWTPLAGGIYYLEVRGGGAATGAYRLAISRDDFGDSVAMAKTVKVPSATIGSIFSAQDADWFQFTATAGISHRLQVSLDGLGSAALRLVAGDGVTELRFDSDGGAGQIDWTPETSGTYFLQVNGVGGGTGDYQLAIYRDDHSDSSALATPLTVTEKAFGAIWSSLDTDWYRFNAQAGQAYAFAVTGAMANPVLRMLGVDGSTQLAVSDTGIPRIFWTAPASGQYYLAVSGKSGAAGAYAIESAFLDDHGDVPTFATNVPVPSTTGGTINFSNDRDWFAFSASAGRQLRFETIAGTLTDTELSVYHPNGVTELVYDDESGPGSLSLIDWTAPATGIYFIVVDGWMNRTGSYQLKISSLPSVQSSEATSNATVQPNGPRGDATGQNFFVTEGSALGNFAAYAVGRFNSNAIKSTFDSQYGVGGWTVEYIDLVLTETVASFSASGPVSFLYSSDDAVSITPGTSPLQFPHTDGEFSDAVNVKSFSYARAASSGTTHTHRLYDVNIANTTGGLAVYNDFRSNGTLTLLLVPDSTTVAASFAGISNTSYPGPSIVVTATAASAAEGNGNGAIELFDSVEGLPTPAINSRSAGTTQFWAAIRSELHSTFQSYFGKNLTVRQSPVSRNALDVALAEYVRLARPVDWQVADRRLSDSGREGVQKRNDSPVAVDAIFEEKVAAMKTWPTF